MLANLVLETSLSADFDVLEEIVYCDASPTVLNEFLSNFGLVLDHFDVESLTHVHYSHFYWRVLLVSSIYPHINLAELADSDLVLEQVLVIESEGR